MPLRSSAPLPRAVDLQALAAGIAFTVIVAMPFGAASAQEPTPSGASMARERIAPAEIVAEIRVHGNLSVPNAEVIALAGVAVGRAGGPGSGEDRAGPSGGERPVRDGRGAPTLPITDRDGPGRPGHRGARASRRPLLEPGGARARRSRPPADGRSDYRPQGRLRRGVRGVDQRRRPALGAGGRLSMPATWGGHKRIALEMEAPVRGPVIDRLRAGGSRGRRRHPHFDVDDDRTRLQLAVERRLAHGFRMNGEAAWEDVRFAARADRLLRTAVHLDYGDYRETPATARRNTMVIRAGVERLALGDGAGSVIRPRLDARAYTAAGGQAVLAGRLFFEGASAPLPAYERALLGGSPAAGGSLRGWPAGIAVGDRLAAASIELRLPITSVLSEGRVGLRLFYDTAAVYDADAPLRRARFLEGAGAGVFFMPPRFGFPVSIDIAHDFAGGVRVHGSAGFGF